MAPRPPGATEPPRTPSLLRRSIENLLNTYMITGQASSDAVVEQIVRALEAGVDRVQIRRKACSAAAIESMIDAVLASQPASRPKLIVNDRLDIALALEVGGVHLPADGLAIGAVRRVAPSGFVIGVSVHELSEARDAERDGADFVVYGPVFPTASKPGHPGVGIARLKRLVDAVAIPVLAVGGISAANVAGVAAAGASGVAAISAFESESQLRELMACR